MHCDILESSLWSDLCHHDLWIQFVGLFRKIPAVQKAGAYCFFGLTGDMQLKWDTNLLLDNFTLRLIYYLVTIVAKSWTCRKKTSNNIEKWNLLESCCSAEVLALVEVQSLLEPTIQCLFSGTFMLQVMALLYCSVFKILPDYSQMNLLFSFQFDSCNVLLYCLVMNFVQQV